MMKVVIGADHRGFKLKEDLKSYNFGFDIAWIDLGAVKLDPDDDYPEIATKLVKLLKDDPEVERGILLCGSGVGVDVVANKFNGIRSGLGINAEQVRSARQDDDINVLAIAADYTDSDMVIEMIKSFLKTEFDNEPDHARRIKQISMIEKKNARQ